MCFIYDTQLCVVYTHLPRGVMNLSAALLPFPFIVHQLQHSSQTSTCSPRTKDNRQEMFQFGETRVPSLISSHLAFVSLGARFSANCAAVV